jgi:predicted Zn-dependent protease
VNEGELAEATVELARAALSGADVEAAADRHQLALTRFANSVIHQNVAEDSTTVRLRIHQDGRTASGSATVLDEDGLRALVGRVTDAVRVAPLDPGWPGPAPSAVPAATPPLDRATAEASATDRAQIVRGFVDGAEGLSTAGYCRTSLWSGAFANSAGQIASGTAAECGVSGIARDAGADGVSRHAPLRIGELDGALLGARAAAKARAWLDPVELPPGRYEVVLEPTAVADIVETLAAAGFNGRALNEGRSFVRVGEAQFDPAITLVDDPLAAGFGFDGDGTPRQRLTMIDRGTSVAGTYDRRSAAEAGVPSTGHAGEGAFTWGPTARHTALSPSGHALGGSDEIAGPEADESVRALVRGVEHGVLVTDLWYTRMLDPRALTITGLTRNGVWLIEHGEITSALRNFRFTQSYAQALMPGNVLAVGAHASPVPGDTYTATSPRWTCPALHLASWNFTGGASG